MNLIVKLLLLVLYTVGFNTTLYSQKIIKKQNHYFTENYKLDKGENVESQQKLSASFQNYDSPLIIKEDFIVNSVDGKYGSNRTNPQIAIDGLGNYAITWIDTRNGYKQIFVQFYDKNDNKVGDEIIVNEIPTDWNNNPAIATNYNGDYIIAWCHNSYTIFAQRMNKYGSKIGNNFQLNSLSISNIGIPSIVVNKNGYFTAVWTNGFLTSNYNLYTRTFDLENSPINDETIINNILGEGGSSIGYGKRIGIDKNGNYGIVWSGFLGGKSNIYFQQLDSTFQKIGNNVIISDTSDRTDYYFPSIAGLKNGTFLIAWEGEGVNSRIYNINSGFVTEQLKIYSSQSSWFPSSVSSDGESNFLVNWSGSSVMKSQKINAESGALVGEITNFSFSDADSIYGYYPTLSNVIDNKMYLTFYKYEGRISEVFLQKYDSEYSFINELKHVSNEKKSSWQNDPIVHTNADGISLVLWKDMRNGIYEFYGQIFDRDFNPIGENFQLNDSENFGLYAETKIKSLSDGNFIVVYTGSDYSSRERIYLTKINTEGEIIKSNYFEDLNYYNYKLQISVNSQDKILITFQSRYSAYLQEFTNDLNTKTNLIQFLKYTDNERYSHLSISINNNFDILAVWKYYNTEEISSDPEILGLLFNKLGKEISNTLIITPKVGNKGIREIEAKLDDNNNYIILLKNVHSLTIIRSYDDSLEPIISSYPLYGYYTSFEFQFFKNRKALFTVTNFNAVYSYFINDNKHSITINNLHNFDPFTRYQLNYYNGNSTSFFNNNLFFLYESNKNGGTGYDIWANVKSIAYADTTEEVAFPIANDDELFLVSPNPVRSNAQIFFRVYSLYNVKISLYNILGERVKELYNKQTEAGYYQINLNTSEFSSGVYFVTMEAFKTKIQKFIILK